MTDYSDLISQNYGPSNPALPTTVGNINEDPDKAQRAIDLSKATGVPPTSIYGDLEEFERQHKAVLASDIVANNPHLTDFVQSDPMVPKLFNRSYGQLDDASSKVSSMSLPMRVLRAPEALAGMLFPGDPTKHFTEGGRLGQWLSSDDVKNYPIAAGVAAGLATPIELILRGLSGTFDTAAEATQHAGEAIGGPSLGRDVGAIAQAEFMGMTGRGHGELGGVAHFNEALKQATDWASVKLWLENGREPPPSLLPEFDKFMADQNKDDIDKLKAATSLAQAIPERETAPEYVRSFFAQHTDAEIGIGGDAVAALYGDKVPAPDDGILGWVPGIEDKLALARETGADVSVPLADWLTHAEPETMQALHDDIRVRPGGITANEVKLASEAKEERAAIEPNEYSVTGADLLGDENQVNTVRLLRNKEGEIVGIDTDYGGIVNVPPVAKGLPTEELIKRTLGGHTTTGEFVGPSKVEAKPLKEPEPLPEEVPSLRAATALEPLFSVGDRKLQLQRMATGKGDRLTPELLAEGNNEILNDSNRTYYENQAASIAAQGSRFGPEQGFHDFNLVDENGQTIGALNISEQKGGKQLYVDNITGVNGLGPNDFGPALIRHIARQIKAEFPAAFGPDGLGIAGHRVSGARERAGKEMTMPEATVKFDRMGDEAGFQKLLEGGQWETYSPNIQAYVKPDAMRSEADRQLVQIVNEEADRIAPKKTAVQVVDTIKAKTGGIAGQRADEDIKVGGAYIRYKETYPIILAALDSKDTLGTFRHEVVHHLRQYGFYTDQEWSTLEASALAEGWLSKYRIDARYPTASPELKLEEAVAEAYPEWKARQEALKQRADQTALPPSPLDAIFQKMKDFFDAIRERVSQIFGKDATWEDVFKRVNTGEVGGREGTEPLDVRAFNEKLAISSQQASKLKTVITPTRSHIMEEGEGTYRALSIENQRGKQLVQAVLMPYKDGYHVGTIDNMTRYQGEHIQGLGEYAYEEAAKWAESQGKKLYAGASEDTSAAAKSTHQRLEDRGLASPTDENGVRQIYSAPKLGEKLSVTVPPEGGSRVFERASALGMTVDQFKAYDKLIAARHAEDIEAAQKRVETQQRREQTKEWKDNRRELRADISKEIHQRPDVAADLFFSTGELYGQKIASGYKLDSNQLTDAQKAAIPKDYQARGGLNPDDVANIFGYGSGDAMLARLAEYNGAKKASGLGAKEFVARVTDAEADRQMRLKYGVLEDNIIDSVKEQVASETQLDILHEETVALGMRTKQAPLDKAQILKDKRTQFGKMQLGSFSSDRFMADAGKAGKAVELAHLKGDPAEAFKEKQRQYYSTILANEAIKTEKALGQFDKLAKRFSKREIATVDQEYTNFIHDILMRVGKPVRRSIQDLETEIAAGEYKSLPEFVQGKETHGLREVPVADILLDPNFRKKFEDLTVDEFRAAHDSVKTLLQNGRDEKKIVKAGEEADLNEVKAQMISQLKEFPERSYDAKGGQKLGPLPTSLSKTLRIYGINHIQTESLLNRWDHGDPNGVFTQYVMRDLVTAANNESAMEKRFAGRMREVDDKADLSKSVDNTLFKVPGTGQVMKFNRGNLRTVLLNAGNESNLSKLARGYGLEPGHVLDWLGRHATKEDWDWAQKMGDVFAEIKQEADVMYRNLSGVAPESLQIKPIQTAHGQYPGWYYPIIFHPEFEGASKKLMGKDALEQDGFVRATTPSGYTKGRTGYAAPMALDLDMLPARMKQMIHDVAMRPSIINASKIFYDKDIRQAVSGHFGNEWRDSLVPYLVDVANSANYMPKNQRAMVQASEFIRQNMISTLVGFNPGTVVKHFLTAGVQSTMEVGPVEFLKALKSLTSINERTGESNWQFAMRESQELQRRHRNYEETLGGTLNTMMPTSGFMTFRQTVQRWASSPVAISDLVSAVPTWLAQYEKTMDEGGTHGDGVFMADRAVRRAHGSTAITNRSQVMRGGAMSQWMASVYGFFNHVMNRQYELMWRAGETIDMVKNKEGTYEDAMKQGGQHTAMLFAYVLAPALIEAAITPLAGSENDSWGKKAAKDVAFTLGASWIGVRDIASAILNGRDPSVGLFSTAYKTVSDIARDLSKPAPLSKEHAGKIIRDGATLMGTLTGVVPGQIGKTAEFGQRVATGQDHPKGPWGWLAGARFGTLKNHSGTFQEWQRHH